MFNCDKCLKKCVASCCGPVPFPKKMFEKLHPVRKAEKRIEVKGYIIAVDENGYCVFLDKELKCSIYHKRPPVCRKFGDESHIHLTCPYQDKNGRIRSGRERRKIDREQNKEIKSVVKKNKR